MDIEKFKGLYAVIYNEKEEKIIEDIMVNDERTLDKLFAFYRKKKGAMLYRYLSEKDIGEMFKDYK
ncbi:MAG: hypothetical protein WC781_04995 [Candidatus Pacearchaeota archaeon]|jgi:hypothetical protein